MSKKHFIKLADSVKYIFKQNDYTERQRIDIINELASFCIMNGSNFNRSRWIDYINGECGPSGGKVKA